MRLKQLKITAVIILLAFSTAQTGYSVDLINSGISVSALSAAPYSLESVRLPAALGRIDRQKSGKAGRPFVICIQDAHAVKDAQINTRKIIAFFQKNYGANLVALEGAKGKLDPLLLRNFPDKKKKRKVFQEYLDKGELSGGELAALLNTGTSEFYGIEDWDLYQKNYFAYLRTMAEKGDLLDKIRVFKESLDRKRSRVYSREHNLLHEEIEKFRNENGNFIGLFKFLRSLKMSDGMIDKYPDIKTLMRALEENEKQSLSQESLILAVRELAFRFQKDFLPRTSKEEQMDFNARFQAFQNGVLDPSDFLKELVRKYSEFGERVRLTPEMRAALRQMKLFSTLQGTKLFDELDSLLKDLEDSLVRSPEERELTVLYKRIRTLKDIVSLESTHDEWNDYRRSRAAHLSIIAVESFGAEDFYQLALARDHALMKNLENSMRPDTKVALVLAGGFHTRGLETLLNQKGYSYAVVTPDINSLEGQEHYGEIMLGKLSYARHLKTTFYDAFLTDCIQKLAEGLNGPEFKKTIKSWRDEVLRALSTERKLDRAPFYTHYIDELAQDYLNKYEPENTSEMNRRASGLLKKEFENLKETSLNRLEKRFNEQFHSFQRDLKEVIRGNAVGAPAINAILNRSEETHPSTLITVRGPLAGDLSVRESAWFRDFYLKQGMVSGMSLGKEEKPQEPEEVLTEYLSAADMQQLRSGKVKIVRPPREETAVSEILDLEIDGKKGKFLLKQALGSTENPDQADWLLQNELRVLYKIRKKNPDGSIWGPPNLLVGQKSDAGIIFPLLDGRNLQFYLMDRIIQKEDLASPLPNQRFRSVDEYIKTALQMAEAIYALNKRKIVHGDIKPSSFWKTKDGRVILYHFNLALPEGESRHEIPVFGTSGYVSPEYIKTYTVRYSDDVYSLAATLAWVWASDEFREAGWPIIAKNRLGGDIRDLFTPALEGNPLKEVILKGLNPERLHRYDNMTQMRFAIYHVIRELRNKSAPPKKSDGNNGGGAASLGLEVYQDPIVSVLPVSNVPVDLQDNLSLAVEASPGITMKDKPAGSQPDLEQVRISFRIRDLIAPADLLSLLADLKADNATGKLKEIETLYLRRWQEIFAEARRGITNDLSAIMNTFDRTEDLVKKIASPGFRDEIEKDLGPWLTMGVLESEDLDAFVSRVRMELFFETSAVIDAALSTAMANLDPAKIDAFSEELNRAISAAGKNSDGTRQYVLAITHPAKDEIALVAKVLQRFSSMIERLEILSEKGEGVNREDWKMFSQLSFQIYDKLNPEKALNQLQKRNSREKMLYAFTKDIGFSKMLKELNNILAEIAIITDDEVRELAYAASVLLLFKLANLNDQTLLEIQANPDKLSQFIQTDETLQFLSADFEIRGGTLRLNVSALIRSFVQEAAAIATIEKAA